MKKNDLELLSVPMRQSPVAIAIILIKFVRNLVRSLWPILLVYFLRRESDGENDWFTYTVLGISSLTVISSIVAYFKYYYYVEGDNFIIQKGILQRKKVTIPVDRVQSINFEQQIIHQVFDVVAVKIDTAGSKKEEIALEAISKEAAQRLKDYILSLKKQSQPEEDTLQPEIAVDEGKELIRLDTGDLMKIGVSQNHLQTAGIMVAFLFGFIDDLESVLGFDVADKIQETLGIVGDSNWFAILFIVLFFLILSFLISLVRTVLRYFQFSMKETSKGFSSQAGLLTKKEKFISLGKIQLVRWRQNPLEKLFDLSEIRIKQASSTEVNASQSFTVPGAYSPEKETIIQASLPNQFMEENDDFGIDRSIVFRIFIYAGCLPAIPIFITVWRQFDWTVAAVVTSLFLILVGLLASRYQKRWHVQVSPLGLITAKGIYSYEHTAIPFLKVQAVRISQNIHQRRRNLASVLLSTASGSVTIPYIPLQDANKLANYILFFVEKDYKSWM